MGSGDFEKNERSVFWVEPATALGRDILDDERLSSTPADRSRQGRPVLLRRLGLRRSGLEVECCKFEISHMTLLSLLLCSLCSKLF